jgi:serine/threonine-protein kinase
MKAMARAKQDRYTDVMALKADLQRYLDGKSVSAKRDSLLVMAKKWIVRNKAASMGIAAAMVCLAIGIASAALFAEKKRQERVTNLLAQAGQAQLSSDFESAEELFFAVLGLDKNNSQARTGIARVSGKALAIKNKRLAQEKIVEAQRLFDSGQFSQAYDAYVAVFALDPESAQAREAIKVAAVKAERQKAEEKSAPILVEAARLQESRAGIEQNTKRLQESIERIKSRIKGHEDYTVKKPLWEKEQELLTTNIERLKIEGQIISGYSTVLSYNGENPEARRALARIYYEKLKQAELLDQKEEMAYFRELMLAFDDGYYQGLLQQDGMLTITTEPAADGYFLFTFVESPDRRLMPARCEPSAASVQAPLGQAAFEPINKFLKLSEAGMLKQIVNLKLPHGSYLIIARKRGFADARIPAIVRRGEETTLARIRLLQGDRVPADFVYVPAGPFIMGGDPVAPYALERTERRVDGFLISRTEVTVGEYLLFINDLEAVLPGSAEKYLPRAAAEGGFYWKKAGNRYQADFPQEWPVLGVSWDDARAYCAWLTRRHADKGWKFRLPEEWEWEKAARGVDGRSFPWGNNFDYRFCSMANSKAGKRSGPDPVGSFPLDESVYGVMDSAGNVAEWCQTFFDQEKNIRITRGAAWSYVDEQYARCAGRNGHSPADVADFRGFRVAMSLGD